MRLTRRSSWKSAHCNLRARRTSRAEPAPPATRRAESIIRHLETLETPRRVCNQGRYVTRPCNFLTSGTIVTRRLERTSARRVTTKRYSYFNINETALDVFRRAMADNVIPFLRARYPWLRLSPFSFPLRSNLFLSVYDVAAAAAGGSGHVQVGTPPHQGAPMLDARPRTMLTPL